MAAFRLLVTGSRHLLVQDHAYVSQMLTRAVRAPVTHGRDVIVVVGGCLTGVDHFAEKWADRNDFEVEVHRARWELYGAKAGPRRNREMAAAGADLCAAFPGPASIGTWDCMKKAVESGIMTFTFPIGALRGTEPFIELPLFEVPG